MASSKNLTVAVPVKNGAAGDCSSHEDVLLGEVVFDNYRVGSVLGSGSFGVVYRAQHIVTKKRMALKLGNSKRTASLMRIEYALYHVQQAYEGNKPSVPRVHRFGEVHGRPAMLMDRLGPSLQTLFEESGRKLQIPMMLQLAVQMIDRLELFHRSTGHVHRDIKPDNFVLDYGDARNGVHLIDYGLAKPFWDSKIHRHVDRCRQRRRFVGTVRYSSINAHRGYEQSRRDDMVALGYSLVYLVRGSLPWQGLKGVTRSQRQEQIVALKLATPVDTLCEGLPVQFAIFLRHCLQLKFTAEPEYCEMRAMFFLLSCQESLSLRSPRPITKRAKTDERNRTTADANESNATGNGNGTNVPCSPHAKRSLRNREV